MGAFLEPLTMTCGGSSLGDDEPEGASRGSVSSSLRVSFCGISGAKFNVELPLAMPLAVSLL